MTLDEYLLIRFIRSNHPKYRKEAKVVNPEVSKCFQALMDALNKQLDSYRK